MFVVLDFGIGVFRYFVRAIALYDAQSRNGLSAVAMAHLYYYALCSGSVLIIM